MAGAFCFGGLGFYGPRIDLRGFGFTKKTSKLPNKKSRFLEARVKMERACRTEMGCGVGKGLSPGGEVGRMEGRVVGSPRGVAALCCPLALRDERSWGKKVDI